MFERPRSSFHEPFRPEPPAFTGLGDCRLAGLQRFKNFAAAPTSHSGYSHLVLYRPSRLPFGRPEMYRRRRSSSHEPFTPQQSRFTGLRDCRLAGLKCTKGAAAAPTSHLRHSHLLLPAFKSAVCQLVTVRTPSQQLPRAIWVTVKGLAPGGSRRPPLRLILRSGQQPLEIRAE